MKISTTTTKLKIDEKLKDKNFDLLLTNFRIHHPITVDIFMIGIHDRIALLLPIIWVHRHNHA
jgi:hypothetical protein